MENKFSNETEFVFSSEFTGFTVIPNHILNNRDISYKALGIYCQILQYQNSPTHKIYLKSLQAYKKDGKESVTSGLNELLNAGYVSKEQLRGEHGKIAGVKYTVYANPCNTSVSAECGKPDFGKADIGKPATYKENTVKNKIPKKENSIEQTDAAKAEITEVTSFYNECFNKKITKQIILAIGEARHNLDIDCIYEAMKRSAIRGKDWAYAYGIIKSWLELGLKTMDDIEAKDQKKATTKPVYASPADEPLTHKNKFTRTYSHNWDQDALEEMGGGDLDRELAKPHESTGIDIRAKYGLKE